MNSTVKTILYYLIAFILILIIHSLSPTNLAGPGLDIVVYFCSLIISLGLLGKSLARRKLNDKTADRPFLINLVGSSVVIVLLLYVVTKKN